MIRDKHIFFATNVLSRQAYFYHDKSRVFLFVATKLILVAASANDRTVLSYRYCGGGGVRNVQEQNLRG